LFGEFGQHPCAEAASRALQAVGGVLPFGVVGGTVEPCKIDIGLGAEEAEQFVLERTVAKRVFGEMDEVDGAAGAARALAERGRILHLLCKARGFHAAAPSIVAADSMKSVTAKPIPIG